MCLAVVEEGLIDKKILVKVLHKSKSSKKYQK